MKCLAGVAWCWLAAVALLGQDVGAAGLQGFVRDPKGSLAADVMVQLKGNGQMVSIRTDAEGRYRFREVRPGSYSVHAEAGAMEADFGPFVLGRQEARSIDLKLAAAEKPAFFDAPSFIVAGVTDGSNRGGHGSDPILHSSEALASATASLGAGEKPGDALEAVRAYQRVAEADPSEAHLFDWGAELLRHRAAEQAGEVFSQGNRLFPRSTRMILGLATAWYSRGSYDKAETLFFQAADLMPEDPTPYLFLGEVRNSAIGQSEGYRVRMERFAGLHPENAKANYYCAVSLPQSDGAKAQELLTKAVRLDPQLGVAWLQLGILFADHGDLDEAVSAWQKATGIETHYRLAQAYRRMGEPVKAKAEIEIWQRMSKEAALEEERARAGIREFVFQLR